MKLPTEAPVNGGRNYDGPKVEFSALLFGDKQGCTLLYAGKSEYPTVLVPLNPRVHWFSENLFGADNQQETDFVSTCFGLLERMKDPQRLYARQLLPKS